MDHASVAVSDKQEGQTMSQKSTNDKLDFLQTHSRPWYVKTLGIVVAVGLATGGWYYWKAQNAQQDLHYITEPATLGSLNVTVTADGTLQPTRTVSVGSELSGIVRKVYVDVNSPVKVGDPLIDLDTRSLKAKVQSAKATLQSAQAQRQESVANLKESQITYKRMLDLHKRSGGLSPSQTELDQQQAKVDVNKASVAVAEANIMSAEATLTTAETDLSKARIASPIDGVVLTRTVEPGLAVAASLQAVQLLTLATDLSKLELQVLVDEADIGVVKEGDPVYFTVSAFPNQHFPATLTKVAYGSATNENVVTYTAYMTVDNSQHLLRPGMTASATIETAKRDGVLLVPNSAFRFVPSTKAATKKPVIQAGPPHRTTVNKTVKDVVIHGETQRELYVLRDGKPLKLTVTTGLTDGNHTEILKGEIRETDQVIIDQQRKAGD